MKKYPCRISVEGALHNGINDHVHTTDVLPLYQKVLNSAYNRFKPGLDNKSGTGNSRTNFSSVYTNCSWRGQACYPHCFTIFISRRWAIDRVTFFVIETHTSFIFLLKAVCVWMGGLLGYDFELSSCEALGSLVLNCYMSY